MKAAQIQTVMPALNPVASRFELCMI